MEEVSKATKPGFVTVTTSSPAVPAIDQETREQEVKVEEKIVVTQEAKAAKQESVSSESESEEEAEYHPNVPVSISHTQILEEKEEEEEEDQVDKHEDKAAEQDTPDVSSPPAEVLQPAEETSQAVEESEAGNQNAEEEKEGEQETEEITNDQMTTPDEAPNGLNPAEEAVSGLATHPEVEDEPKMNGQASLVEAELRPQVICCSEVKSSLGRLWSFPGLWPSPANCRNTHFFFLPPAFHSAGFLPACVNI